MLLATFAGLEFASLEVDGETGDVYLHTRNQLLLYSPDLQLQKVLLTGEIRTRFL